MSVKIDAGRRSIFVEKEVPGTPEEVWVAIASGPGISSWFIPTDVEPGVGGRVVYHFGPGMDAGSTIREWDAPRRFYLEGDEPGGGAPGMAAEWIVEARSGGTCVVRVVNSFFTDSEDWDDQLTGLEGGWPGFFEVLDLYLRHFRGLPPSSFLLMNMGAGEAPEVWSRFQEALGAAGAKVGDPLRSPAGVPAFVGRVEMTGSGLSPQSLMLRLSEPCPGTLCFGVPEMGRQATLVITAYLYGGEIQEKAAAMEQEWGAWLNAFRPPAAAESTGEPATSEPA